MNLYHFDDASIESNEDHGFEEEFVLEEESLERRIQMKLVEFQSILDTSNVPIFNQNEILKLLFGDINVQNQCLKSLIKMLPNPWDGRLEEFQFPNSFYDIFNLYGRLGMIKPLR
jgi:hypothetical protein